MTAGLAAGIAVRTQHGVTGAPAARHTARSEPPPVCRDLCLSRSDPIRRSPDPGRTTGLNVSRPDDPEERAAERAADTIMRSAGSSCTGCDADAPCAGCTDEDHTVHRDAAATGPVTVGSLSSVAGGRPLDHDTRARFEPRFGADFGAVRIHTSPSAARNADALAANAFTIGNEITFAAGRYAPGTARGRHLLAHELAHVVQHGHGGTATVHRDDAGTPDAGGAPAKAAPPPRAMANTKLTDADQKAILKAVPGAAASGSMSATTTGTRFVLHDTAARPTVVGKTAADRAASLETKESRRIAELAAIGGTPVGEGPAAYVTGAGTPLVAHPRFFGGDRPTATEFERGNDLMAKIDREKNMQAVWALTDAAARAAAITSYLSGFATLSKKQVAAETAKAEKNLDPAQSVPNNDPGKSVVFTTATGAVRLICNQVGSTGAAGVAVAGKEKELVAACAALSPLFAARSSRIATSANVEISAETGSDCRTDNKARPFSGYVPAVYDAVAQLYLRAAAEAGTYPEITTHYFLDSKPITGAMNRCDPRCFDLGRLYTKIAALLGHPAGTTYGVEFRPGLKWGTSTVWWHDPVCGPLAPAPAPAPPPPPKSSSIWNLLDLVPRLIRSATGSAPATPEDAGR